MFNKGSSSKSKQMCLIVNRQGLTIDSALTIKTRRQIDQIRLSQCYFSHCLFLRLILIVAGRSALFIKVGVACVYRGSYLKEELVLAIDKYFLLHYPTRDMQISYKLAFSYPKNFSYPNVS